MASVALAAAASAADVTLELQFNNYLDKSATAFVRPSVIRDVAPYGKELVTAPQPPVVTSSGTSNYTLGFQRKDSMSMTICEFGIDVGFQTIGGVVALTSCSVRTTRGGSDGMNCTVRHQLDYAARKCIADVDIR